MNNENDVMSFSSFGEKQETAHYVLYYVNLHRDDTEKLRGMLGTVSVEVCNGA